MAEQDEGPAWSGTALVVRGSEVLEERALGRTAGADSPPCRPRSVFQACSISKLVVSAVVLALVEAGDLDLERPVTTWLDDLPASWSGITLHHLLSNSSGLGHWGDVPGLPPLLTTAPPLDELLALIAAAPPVSRPGAAWRYSGPGFLTATRVVDAVTGQSWATTAEALVLAPAGMTATRSGAAPAGPDLAVGHDHGRLRPLHPGFAAITGSGDLWTTTGDLVRLLQALRAGAVVPTRSAELLWTQHVALPAGDPGTGAMTLTGYGYGTFLGQVRGHRARVNPGDMPGYQTLLAHLPDSDVDLAVLCNEEPPSLDRALAGLRLP